MSQRRVYGLALGGLLMLALPAAPAGAGQVAGKRAAAFTLPDLGGKPTTLAELQGKVVLVDFWATWCEPCLKELPALEKLHQQLAAQGVVIVGVSIDKERQNAQELATRLGLKFKLLHDPAGKVAELYDPPKMPTSYVIDRQGVVRFVNEGFVGAADVAKLQRQLAQLTGAGSPEKAPEKAPEKSVEKAVEKAPDRAAEPAEKPASIAAPAP